MRWWYDEFKYSAFEVHINGDGDFIQDTFYA